jgi:hypothetical protein
MRNMFKSAKLRRQQQRRTDMYRALLHYEARLGGELFGPIPKGVRREFFCLDKHTWVWHEEWDDQQGNHQAVTTRYDVRPSGAVKSQGTHSYQALSYQETQNLYRAVKLYTERVGSELARLAQAA